MMYDAWRMIILSVNGYDLFDKKLKFKLVMQQAKILHEILKQKLRTAPPKLNYFKLHPSFVLQSLE